jgi:hypothetical protein
VEKSIDINVDDGALSMAVGYLPGQDARNESIGASPSA